MTVSKEDAERDLIRRLTQDTTLEDGTVQLGFINQVTKAVGSDEFLGMTPQQQAALTSLSYNYGGVPSSVVTAIKNNDLNTVEGRQNVASAISSLEDNPNRRAEEASMFAMSRAETEGKDVNAETTKITATEVNDDPTLKGLGNTFCCRKNS